MSGFISTYQLTFPITGKVLHINSNDPRLERVTAACENKGIPCVVFHGASGSWEFVWQSIPDLFTP